MFFTIIFCYRGILLTEFPPSLYKTTSILKTHDVTLVLYSTHKWFFKEIRETMFFFVIKTFFFTEDLKVYKSGRQINALVL